MRNKVYVSVGRQSFRLYVCPSVPSNRRCSGFAAVGPAVREVDDRGGRRAPQHGAQQRDVRRPNAGSATMSADVDMFQ